jgi:aldehyde dehydrogenase (NAD+)
MVIPDRIPNLIAGKEIFKTDHFIKKNPDQENLITTVSRAEPSDVEDAVNSGAKAQEHWKQIPGVKRGEILYKLVDLLENNADQIARIAALETGKKNKDAWGEMQGVLALGRFFASEGQRLFGRTMTSGVENRWPILIREPLGVCALITPANTPIANVAWKIFPALICGNAAILKPSEDSPVTSWLMAKCVYDSGIDPGLFSLLQSDNPTVSQVLINNSKVSMVSFTGSSLTGRKISEQCGKRMIRCSLELGGKNPFAVCDDADIETAVNWALLSAFSNAGQRCASGSRIIVMKNVYSKFKELLIQKTKSLKLGVGEDDDLGPLVSERHLNFVLSIISEAKKEGTKILTGGSRLDSQQRGYYLEPTVFEETNPNSKLAQTEVFGPITSLFVANDFEDLCNLALNSSYGLTAAIHTTNINRALEFSKKIKAGMVQVNAGTYGSEPHFPFGGSGLSGNGTREPGLEAVELYSQIKNICINVNPKGV